MSRSLFLGFVVGVVVFAIAGVGASQLQDKNVELKKANEKQYRTELVDATPVQLGALTEKQRLHSQLFNGSGMPGESKTISEWITEYRGQRIVLVRTLLGRTFLASGRQPTAEEYFGRLAKDSDAIIRGRVINKVSQITEDDSFLFTDYDVTVLEVLRDNSSSPLSIGTTLTITCLGGKIVVDDIILKAGGNGDASLPVNAQNVLLFVKFIPETGAYRLTQPNAAFELTGTSVRPLAGLLPLPSDIFKDETSFVKTVKRSIK
ncbi:MAG TPA: hypothetical protein VJ464_13700 [Blastocatellia bacterium]|nr:hypothetical protein [Blastocatellia bacterium]